MHYKKKNSHHKNNQNTLHTLHTKVIAHDRRRKSWQLHVIMHETEKEENLQPRNQNSLATDKATSFPYHERFVAKTQNK